MLYSDRGGVGAVGTSADFLALPILYYPQSLLAKASKILSYGLPASLAFQTFYIHILGHERDGRNVFHVEVL
jgi:hypothetical protein